MFTPLWTSFGGPVRCSDRGCEMTRLGKSLRLSCCAVAATMALWATSATAEAATIRVPNDAPTVAGALALAENGDKIILLGGSYNETVEVNGLSDLTIKARGGPRWCRPPTVRHR